MTEQGEHVFPIISTKKRNKWVFDRFGKGFNFNTQLLIDYETQVIIPALNLDREKIGDKLLEMRADEDKLDKVFTDTEVADQIIKLIRGK